MTMPISLVLLRHGESESNKAKSLFEAGKILASEDGLMNIHTSERRLTPLGVNQAKTAGSWLTQNWFDEAHESDYRLIVSPYVRAMETAGNLGFGNDWRHDIRVVERNWGEFDQMPYAERARLFQTELKLRKEHAFFWRPTNGETLQDVFSRLRDMTGTLHRECSNKRVLVVSHGETMWVWRTILERMLPQELRAAMLSNDDRIWIHNCRVIEYTRLSEDGTLEPRFVRFRFVNTADPNDPDSNTGWMPLTRRTWTHAELLEFVSTFKTFLPEDEDIAA